ncbi:uncharacterized protein LOC105432820 [Pogonomyrmex barbatus]|uniref:Uncharacterized protein LOC105432820 n=1 Tax=Pogonomyrmex barbatus TaxID=144034 RepID=A0A6I9XJY6_9HYME|nr:uncharacterized protein LOC105432820 [Pogonomyrmex barbatus]
MNKFLALTLLATYAVAGPTTVSVQPSQDLDCLEHDNALFSCIFVKTVSVLNKAARSSDINVIDGVTFVRDTPMERTSKSFDKTEVEIMNELPRDTSDKVVKLLSMLYDSTVSFMKSHSLKLSMPESSISRALIEGRGKIKKMILPLIAAAGIKIFALVPILLGGLGLLALKALIFGKIALLVAGVMAFQKLFGGGGIGGSSIGSNLFSKNPAPVWYDNGVAGNWAAGGPSGLQHQGYRSFDRADTNVDAHNLAYSAHAPVPNGTD